jgi:tetratricopeptide (TPR) repeat protein
MTSRFWLCLCLAELGEYKEAITCAENSVRDAENVAPPNSQLLMIAYLGLGNLHLHRGSVDTAVRLIERAFTECQRGEHASNFPALASRLGHAYVLSGRWAEALPLFEQAEQQAASAGYQSWRARRLAHLGEAYLVAGQPEEAFAAASRAVNVARAQDERGHEAWALCLMGEIASHGDRRDFQQAQSYYREAWTIASELGMRPLVAHCHFGLAELSRHVGHRPEALEDLTTATTMYREMGMTYWLEKAAAQMQAAR